MAADFLSDALENLVGDDGIKVPGLGVIIFKDGAEIYSNFLGRRVIETSLPVTRHTRFRVASVSKMFTVFSILQLGEQGKINLDDDISQYLGFNFRNPNFSQKKISARMLASHTSSLRDGKIYSSPPDVSVEEFFRPDGKFFEDGAHFANEPPEKFFTYCNLNYGLLGTIIERVTAKRFDIFQRENILAQLETNADYVPANFSAENFNLLGTIYRKKNPDGVWNEFGAWFPQIDNFKIQPAKNFLTLQNPYDEKFSGEFDLKNYRVGTNATIFSPQGGLRISFDELSHALEMLMNDGIFRGKKILNRDSIAMMLTPQWIFDGTNGDTCKGVMTSYGLGFYFVDGKTSARLCKNFAIDFVGHTGAAFGLLAGLFFAPKKNFGFLYAANGEPVEEFVDPKSRGIFSSNFILEEKITDAVCNFLCAV